MPHVPRAQGAPRARRTAGGRFGPGWRLSPDRPLAASVARAGDAPAAGRTRSDVFVSNAVPCNPRSSDGLRNRPPSRAELAACADHLRRQLEIIDPLVVAPLGAVALAALERAAPPALALRSTIGRPVRWDGRWLFPLSHPGDRALLHRPLENQLADILALYRFVVDLRSAP